MTGEVDWLFYDLNSFFASCEQQDEERLRGKPIGILPSIVQNTCCIAASYAAKKFGVKTGTMVKEAKARCPDIEFIAARPRRYVEFHNAILETVEKLIHIDYVESIDEFACRLMGSERRVENAMALAKEMKAAVRREVGECLTSSIGLAPTKFLAKTATDMQKPDGLVVLTHDTLQERLSPLDLEDLCGIGPRMRARLVRAGIHTVGDLWAADRKSLKFVWGGVEGERYWDQLHGIEPWRPPTQTRCVGHQHVLEPELRTPEGIDSYAQALLVKAAQRLRGKGYRCQRLLLSVDWMNSSFGTAAAVRFHPSDETKPLLHLLRKRLLPELPKGMKPIRVGVQLDELVLADKFQMDFFNSPKSSALDKALDRLNDRFGRDTVYFGGTAAQARGFDTRISFRRVPTLDEY